MDSSLPLDIAPASGPAFSDSQLRDLEIIERSMSCLSLMGSLFIMFTFALWPTFRKPINRLVFFASIGNLACNIATLISVSGTMYGSTSALCQLQAFLIQMFIPADSLWTFCMALNVYLTFFKSYDSSMLRALEKWYFLACYGLALLPALIFLIIDNASSGTNIYGPATLWCWIAVEWDWMRIAFFYGPVWIVIAITTTIYLVTGKDIFKQRAALRAFSKDQPRPPVPIRENPFDVNEGLEVTKVVDINIEITHEPIRPLSRDDRLKSIGSEDGTRSSFSSTRKFTNSSRVTIDPWPYPQGAPGDRVPRENTNPNFSTTVYAGETPRQTEAEGQEERKPTRLEAKAMKREAKAHRKRTAAARHANSAAWGYAKVSMLMFLALFVVWVPSTINRVYSLIHPQEPNFALSFMAGLVLPLQGFWNAIIYVITTWKQCKDAFHSIFPQRRRFRPVAPHNRHDRHDSLAPHFGSTFHSRTPLHSESENNLRSNNTMGTNHSFEGESRESNSTPDRSYQGTSSTCDDIELSSPVSHGGAR